MSVRAIFAAILCASAMKSAMAANCLVIGDSIAKGVSAHLPSCAIEAKIGRTTKQAIEVVPRLMPRTVIVSVGSNDSNPSRAQFERLRSALGARDVIWLLPANSAIARAYIRETATRNHDLTLPLAWVGPDGTHPTPQGYKAMASQLGVIAMPSRLSN